jgi:hypothetical protein
MKRLVVRIQKDDQSDPEVFEVPGDQPATDLVSNLVKALNLPIRDRNNLPVEYWLGTASGELIRDDDTLNGVGIGNRALLLIRSGTSRPAELSEPGSGIQPTKLSRSKSDRVQAGDSARTDSPWAKGFRPITPSRPRSSNTNSLPPAGWKKTSPS